MTRKLVHDKAELVKVLDEDEDTMTVRLAAAREIVQSYGGYSAYKSADALEKATFTARGAYITFTHPSDHGVVTNQEEILGFAGKPEFDSENSRLFVEAEIDKNRTKPKVVEGINEGRITDVSIGFYTDEIPEEGDFEGEHYDVRQKNIVIDHVAILPEDSQGRCSSEDGCGIVENIDEAHADSLGHEDGDRSIADIAGNDPEALEDAHALLDLLGFDVEARECNCGDHHGHLTVDGSDEETLGIVFEWDAIKEEFGDDKGFEDETRQGFIRQASKDSHRPMSNDKSIEDYNIDELKDHDEVQKLVDKANEAEERADKLEDELEEIKEREADELRDELVDEFGVAEDKVEEKDLDALEDLKDTLEASDLTSESDEDEDEDEDGEAEGDTAHTKTSSAKSDNDNNDKNPLMPQDSRRRVSRE